MKSRYIVHWSTLPGAFRDEPNEAGAIFHARTMARFLSPESRWAVYDSFAKRVVATSEADGIAFFAQSRG